MPKQTTIFKQLIFNVVFPAFMALILLGLLNYYHTRSILVKNIYTQNQIISDEIKNVLEFQDLALSILENEMNRQMEAASNELVQKVFRDTKNIGSANLYDIRAKIGLDTAKQDIYVINREGIIINTTFKKDLNRNMFDFGEAHKKYLLHIWDEKKFLPERFGIEASTKRLKKYSYHPTLDGKYIIELGSYSERADDIIAFIKNRLNGISEKKLGIVSCDLFMGADNPFSLNKEATIIPEHLKLLKELFRTKSSDQILSKEKGSYMQYDYIYMDRKGSDLYRSSVIRIITDRSIDQAILRKELVKFLLIFLLTVSAVLTLIYRKTRVITDPIKKLVEKVMSISDRNLSVRAEVLGNNEITTLSMKFNIMIEQLESYYYELEEKVRERTAQIQHQKEEIEAQRDAIESQKNILADINQNLQKAYVEIEDQKKAIMDSIYYARRIQNAILPPDDYVKKALPDSFILYLPKDIVSGDFYWIAQRKGKTVFAAVDCTGHGVPGAFMSIVGNNQLNYAVNIVSQTRPADILNSLNYGVTHTLRQTKTSTPVRDGMDISLCVLDFEKKSLEYAGAYNPVYLVRNGELITYKADKVPIGAFIDEELHEYTNNTIELQTGDMIYISSDGFEDQFGGEQNKKFMVSRFRSLLLSIAPEPIERQKELLHKALLDWMGDNEQVDDILVMGVRIS